MSRTTIVFLVAALTALVAAPAQAHHKRTGASSFQGNCAFSVTVRFTPPLTGTPQEGTDFARGAGPCSGTFTDRRGRTHQLDGSKVGYVAWDSGPSSCAEGAASGGGYLSYRGNKLRFALREARVGPTAALHFDGRRGGSADGEANVSQDTDPAEVAQKCLGPGLAESQVDITFATTPTISG
jgi:hypothetical protein